MFKDRSRLVRKLGSSTNREESEIEMNTQHSNVKSIAKRGMPLFLAAIMISAMGLTACQPIVVEGTPVPTEEATVEATVEAASGDAAIVALVSEALAAELQIDVDQVEVVSMEAVEWSDSCLGISDPETMCSMAITPGYRIVLSVDGVEYEYHTNEDGSIALLASDEVAEIGSLAAQALADELQISVDTVEVVSTEAVEWPDSCLGVNDPETMCAQVITPGYLVVLSVDGEQYEYHTNEDGSVMLLATEDGA